MKLSVKGTWKILKQLGKPIDMKDVIRVEMLEFEPDDFKNMVCLSVAEAHQIRWAMNPAPEDCIWRDLLEERIEQAEMSKQST